MQENEIILTKKSRKSMMGQAGTYYITDENNNIVLKANKKPWKGKTTNMGNYMGVIYGSARYTEVTLGATWEDNYVIHFIPNNQQ